jgi:uncharacterized protein with von Willebrand factor type A (vWA) domain
VVVASDGWYCDSRLVVAWVLGRIWLRGPGVVWFNPRAAAPGFQPLVGSMAAALPFCDDFVPANTVRAIGAALDAILAD